MLIIYNTPVKGSTNILADPGFAKQISCHYPTLNEFRVKGENCYYSYILARETKDTTLYVLL